MASWVSWRRVPLRNTGIIVNPLCLLFAGTFAFERGIHAESNAPSPQLSSHAHGLQVGLRVGLGLQYRSSNVLIPDRETDFFDVPFILDVGYRVWPHVYLGALGQAGPVAAGTERCQGDGCSGWRYRTGVNAQYHPLSDGSWDPWVGIGFGYEWIHYWFNPSPREVTIRGPELANLQLGVSNWVADHFAIGGFVQFSTVHDVLAFSNSFDQWLTLGVAATYAPGW